MHRIVPVMLAVSCASAFAEPTGTAVEWMNLDTGYYVITTDSAAIASLGDAGKSLVRTGGEFATYVHGDDAAGLSPVCRFLSASASAGYSPVYVADAGECNERKADPQWAYDGIAFYIQQPRRGECVAGTTPVYRSYNGAAARDGGNYRYTVDPTVYSNSASAGYVAQGIVMCAPLSSADVEADAVRLLRQATFGPTEAELQRVMALGAAAWIDDQLDMPATQYPLYPWMPAKSPPYCKNDRPAVLAPDSYCYRANYTLFDLQRAFFHDALAEPDQLRQRVAFALSQIMVTSGVQNQRYYAMRDYQQMLRDRAFGSFADLLRAVTLSPVMGEFLNTIDNKKSNPVDDTDPNENYAREVLQLFTIGTYALDAAGTRQVDPSGAPVATYDPAVIRGFARVFTGFTYPALAFGAQDASDPRNYLGDMRAVDASHEPGTKILLRGVLAPAGMTPVQDVDYALANIVSHPNVGPFIGRQLIQKLVTSNPSGAYVARIAAVFDDNGAGQRGDLRAVVRAILMDPEARGARKIDPRYGKLVEPVLFMTSLARTAGTQTDAVLFLQWAGTLGQPVFYAPSVFNYYSADYLVPRSSLAGPEFGVQSSATSLGRDNFANVLLYSNSANPDASVYGAIGTTVDLSSYRAVAGDASALAAKLDRNLLAGRMSASMRGAIVAAVNALPASDTRARARAALWLTATSPQFQVQR